MIQYETLKLAIRLPPPRLAMILLCVILSDCGSATAPRGVAASRSAPRISQPLIHVGRFVARARRKGAGIVIYLNTDMPNDAKISVIIGRDFTVTEDGLSPDGLACNHCYSHDSGVIYLNVQARTSRYKTPSFIPTGRKITSAAIQKFLHEWAGLHPTISSISQTISVTFMTDCLHSLEGRAAKKCPGSLGRLATSTVHVNYPYQ